MNYFGIAMKYNDVVELDHWLRRRIRMCYWKQWRRMQETHRRTDKAWCSEVSRDSYRVEQEGLLASCKDLVYELRLGQRVS